MKREEAEESVAWANAMAKLYYDSKHKAIDLKVGDETFLTLHLGYTLRGLGNSKPSQQRAGPFKIMAKVGTLAYRLELPPLMKIHPVISIAQLEPVSKSPDLYGRQRNAPQYPLDDISDLDEDEFHVERIIDKKIVGERSQFLVKWRNTGPERNVWYALEDLKDCMDLVRVHLSFLLFKRLAFTRVCVLVLLTTTSFCTAEDF